MDQGRFQPLSAIGHRARNASYSLIMNPLLKNFLLTLQRRLLLGRLVSVDDLPKSNNVLHHAATLAEIRGYAFHRIQDMGVILSRRRMHFLDVKIPARPEVVSSVETQYNHFHLRGGHSFRNPR